MRLDPDLVRKCVRLYKLAFALLLLVENDVIEFCKRNRIVLPPCRCNAFEPIQNAMYVEGELGVECLMAYRVYDRNAKAGFLVIKPDGRLEFHKSRDEEEDEEEEVED